MPTLDWLGKSKVINHHQEVHFGCWKSNIHMVQTAVKT